MAEFMTSLESALTSNGVQVPQGAIQQMLDQKQWIYSSERVEKMESTMKNIIKKRLNLDQMYLSESDETKKDKMLKDLATEQLYNVFNSQHHLQASAKLFEILSKRTKKVYPKE